MVGKWLEYLKEADPRVRRVGFLFRPGTAPHALSFRDTIQSAAQRMSVELINLPAVDPAEIRTQLENLNKEPGPGLIVVNEAFTTVNRSLIISVAAEQGIPAIYPFRFFVTDGGLMSYGVEQIDIIRRSSSYIDRVLKGEHAGTLPVQQPTKFELLINMKSAKRLGLTIPPTLLARADEVIE
jgi:ABC-type uncharacterized transport system substrate-binding protein